MILKWIQFQGNHNTNDEEEDLYSNEDSDAGNYTTTEKTQDHTFNDHPHSKKRKTNEGTNMTSKNKPLNTKHSQKAASSTNSQAVVKANHETLTNFMRKHASTQ